MGYRKEIGRMVDLCTQQGITLVLDAQTEDRSIRMTSLEKELACIMENFRQWVSENSLKAGDIWYADLFETTEGRPFRHIASLSVESDGVSVRMEAAPAGSKVAAFRRKPGIRRRIREIKEFFAGKRRG